MATIDVNKIVENAMINLSLDFPIYTNLITRIGYRVTHEGTKRAIAYTNGTSITINADEVERWNLDPMVEFEGKMVNRTITQKEMQFLLCHELLHLLGLTHERMKNVKLYVADIAANDEVLRKFEIWNQATDYEINSLLWNNETTDPEFGDKKRHPVGNMPAVGCYKDEYKDMTAEEIYAKLIEKEKRENNGMLLKPQNPMVIPGDGDDDDESDNGKSLAVKGIGGTALDMHMPIESEDAKNEMLSKMSEVFGSKGNGLGESAIDRMVNRVYKPVPFNWRKALTKYIRSYIKSNYTWNKPSRAGIANNLILPSAGTTPSLHVGVAIDTSGSISDKEINAMMDHVFTILQQFKSFEVDLWACGSKVYEESLIKITNQNKKDLEKFNPISDGGNDMRKNFKFVRDHYKGKDKIDLLIILSDFIDPLDGDDETTSICPCVFLCIDHKDFKKPSKIKGEVYPFSVENWKD